MDGKTELGVRLAIRRDGDFVNAYIAKAETMEGAKLIGSLLLVVAQNGAMFERWKALMCSELANFVEEIYGERPTMVEYEAPEHERSGES